MLKRFLCGIFAMLMTVSLFPVTAKAAEIGHPDYPNNPPADVDTVAEKVDWIADQCRAAGVTGEWEIALWLHDWLIYNANYDYTYSRFGASGVLLKGSGVCASYTDAYTYLLDEFGIESMYLSSRQMNHAWNLVKIDGEWCHIDCTWDDPNEGGDECHDYFGLTDKMMREDHTWIGADYPECTSKINYYPIRMGHGYLCESSEEMLTILDKEAADCKEQFVLCYATDEQTFSMVNLFEEWYKANQRKYGMYKCTYVDAGDSLNISLFYSDSVYETREEMMVILDKCAANREEEIRVYYIGDDPALNSYSLFMEWYRENQGKYHIDGYIKHNVEDEVRYVLMYSDEHQYEEMWVEATCTEPGYIKYVCGCGEYYIDEDSYYGPWGHDFENGVCFRCGETGLPGDLDDNQTVDVDDVLALLWHVLFPDDYPIDAQADFDGNGATDVDDVLTLLWHVLFPETYPL